MLFLDHNFLLMVWAFSNSCMWDGQQSYAELLPSKPIYLNMLKLKQVCEGLPGECRVWDIIFSLFLTPLLLLLPVYHKKSLVPSFPHMSLDVQIIFFTIYSFILPGFLLTMIWVGKPPGLSHPCAYKLHS